MRGLQGPHAPALVIIVVILLLVGIFKRSNTRTTPWWAEVRKCPHCFMKMDARATACPSCGRNVQATIGGLAMSDGYSLGWP